MKERRGWGWRDLRIGHVRNKEPEVECNSQGTRLGEQVCREGHAGEREDWSIGFKATQGSQRYLHGQMNRRGSGLGISHMCNLKY